MHSLKTSMGLLLRTKLEVLRDREEEERRQADVLEERELIWTECSQEVT